MLTLNFLSVCFFFFNDTATTEIYTLSLHDALPISTSAPSPCRATPKAPESSLVGEGVSTDILLLSRIWLSSTFAPTEPALTSTPATLWLSTLCSTVSPVPVISTPAQEQPSAWTPSSTTYEPASMTQLVAGPWMTGRFPVPYAPTVIGLALFPLAVILRLPVDTSPRLKRRRSPGASDAVFGFARVFHALVSEVPALRSLPPTLST